MSLAEAKAAARRVAQAARAAAHAAGQAGGQAGGQGAGQGAAADHLAAVLAPHAGRVLAGYMPMRTEIDPVPALARHRGPLCLPVVTAPAAPLAFRAWRPGAPLVPGAFGTLVPAAGDWLVPGVLVVPLLAFDRRGYRLGYGGGFYDRTLQALRAGGAVRAIGFAFAAQELPEVPTDATDQPLDLIVTERGALVPQP
ncbi:5-formyltetrahydrofolate cyclo-ligase [Ruixingdingia sedimenti]|uniref:5-formyltetrahydrofolate cyclo-ligase n=1 Tax=Ruixingdingia sedimenti TaxID=3073604 RepID=A0ABU1FC20_9RHOB|nr:5-formyltetrahydrofolate cyclo-ligase [Xinfangfangia sp. LG-4]MDR5654450.1 5-formyltetrahydrofolate cyclo-ligase [Xinfangfangia sp. LG-4]